MMSGRGPLDRQTVLAAFQRLRPIYNQIPVPEARLVVGARGAQPKKSTCSWGLSNSAPCTLDKQTNCPQFISRRIATGKMISYVVQCVVSSLVVHFRVFLVQRGGMKS